MGGGTLKIINKCREKNLPEPEFSGMGGGFKVAFKKGSVGEKDAQEAEKNRDKTTLKTIKQVRRKVRRKCRALPTEPRGQVAEL